MPIVPTKVRRTLHQDLNCGHLVRSVTTEDVLSVLVDVAGGLAEAKQSSGAEGWLATQCTNAKTCIDGGNIDAFVINQCNCPSSAAQWWKSEWASLPSRQTSCSMNCDKFVRICGGAASWGTVPMGFHTCASVRIAKPRWIVGLIQRSWLYFPFCFTSC